MARKKKANVYGEEFKSSFGVNASVPDPHSSGKTVKTPLDDSDPQEPMQKIDDKGSHLTGQSDAPMHEALASKDGMMNEILKVLRDSQKSKVAEAYANIVNSEESEEDPVNEEMSDEDREAVEEYYRLYGDEALSEADDTKVDIHVDGGDAHKDDDDEEDKDDEDDEETKSEGRSYLRNHILKSLYEEDDQDFNEEIEEEVEQQQPEQKRQYIWKDDIREEDVDISDLEYFSEEDDKSDNPFAKKKDDDSDDDEDDKDSKKDDDEDDDDKKGKGSKVEVTVNESDPKNESFTKLTKDDLIMEYNIDGLFKSGKFSKQFVSKAKAMFESAVLVNVNANLNNLQKVVNKNAEQEAVKLRENLVGQLDSYLTYVIEHFVEDNRLAVENGLRMEIYENFMHELKGLFERHYIHIPEEKTDVMDVMAQKLEKAERDLNEEIQRNIKLNSKFLDLKRATIFERVSKPLSASNKNRLKNLAENLDYINDDDFESKLSEMKSVFLGESVSQTTLKRPKVVNDMFSNDYIGVQPRKEENSLIEAVVAKIDTLSRK